MIIKIPFLARNKSPLRPGGLRMQSSSIIAAENKKASGKINIDETHSPDGKRRMLNETYTSAAGMQERQGRYSPGYNLIITIGGIVIAETIAMIVIYFVRFLPYYQQVLLDAAVMTVIISPLLYLLSTQPLLRQIQQRVQTENVIQARLRLIQFADSHSLYELLRATLDEIEVLTGGRIGYFHALEQDQKTLKIQAWSTNTLQSGHTESVRDGHYDVDRAGVWADCIRQRQPIVHNDYASLQHLKGMPEGHIPVVREMAVPIMRDGEVVAVLGIGNKPQDFTPSDVELVATFADFAWDIIKHKQAGEALRKSEEKFRTLVDWTYDWEIWLDPMGNVVYNSPSCKRITGYGPQEFIHDPDLLIHMVHPDDREFYNEHQKLVHDKTAGVEKIEFRIVTRDGDENWMEHICRPLFGEDGGYLGRRVSNRDITERKQVERDIRERNQNEKMLTQTIHNMQLDIARDLHDTLGQNIGFLRMQLDHLAGKDTKDQADMQVEIKNMARAANESYDLIRGMLAILQSVNSTDLYRLFSRYAEQIEERSSFKIDFSNAGESKPLSAPRIRQLFYIFREVLSNVEKHSGASRVTIEMIWGPDLLHFSVSDNGKGFDKNKLPFGSHYGLKFMRERVELLNGSFDLCSTIGSGTNVVVKIPYKQP